MCMYVLYLSFVLMFAAEESVLRDLKALLIEANQKVPPFLQQMDALSDDLIDLGGQYIS